PVVLEPVCECFEDLIHSLLSEEFQPSRQRLTNDVQTK
ncbi:MAG: hypothetical protein ACI92S_005011, partial [Planctomycetaceae bacterium]